MLGTRSMRYPDTEGAMGWDVSEQGFRIVLTREVPDIVHRDFARDLDGVLTAHGLSTADIGTWIRHPGGPAVLRAYATALDLPVGALDWAWSCLHEVGHLSSASVLLILEAVMARQPPAPGTLGLLTAMGPGFCSQLVLLQG
jgi:alkylresorcinol/alkylpyrone synthase